MMAQQQLAAVAQAQAAAAQAHAHALQQQIPPPHPKSDVMTEDKLQQKGKWLHTCYLLLIFTTQRKQSLTSWTNRGSCGLHSPIWRPLKKKLFIASVLISLFPHNI